MIIINIPFVLILGVRLHIQNINDFLDFIFLPDLNLHFSHTIFAAIIRPKTNIIIIPRNTTNQRTKPKKVNSVCRFCVFVFAHFSFYKKKNIIRSYMSDLFDRSVKSVATFIVMFFSSLSRSMFLFVFLLVFFFLLWKTKCS